MYCFVGELRLGKENSAERHAITAADQFAFTIPDFERMHATVFTERGIGAHDARRDPGDVPAALAAAGASRDNALEIAIERDSVVTLAHKLAQPLRHVEFM